MLKRLKPLVFLILDGFDHTPNRQDKIIILGDTLLMFGALTMLAILDVTHSVEMSGKFLLKAA